jgi:signal transduction histidine kinase
MMTGGGILRLARAQLDATPDGVPQGLSFARIGALDSVVPHAGTLVASPAVTADRSGRLYFTTTDSIVSVDPATVSDSPMIPPIVLESVLVDNQPVDHAAVNRFIQPSLLQFQYTSLNIHSAESARFRYRLDDYDADWVEAGNARQVTYGALRPGEYQFRVIGAGAEGVWNETGASFAFQIVPVFWRTWWFQLSMVALGLSIAGGLYRFRIRQLTRQFNLGVEARVGERTRIARELHDTLLQSFQGVVIHFQAATNMLPGRPEDAKRKFEGALDQAAQAITEGRDAVQAMRDSVAASDDLPLALAALAEQLTGDADAGHAATIRVNVEGSPRSLHPIVRDDVYRIASEAMRNATRHARATLILVDVHYDPQSLRLRVRDDGTGIDAAVLENRGVSGHWGLPGMRERAELIGGKLDVHSRVGAGTEVELALPESKAYATAPRRRFWSRRRRAKAQS